MRKVSVIVPVYNGEKYLKRCLDSLVNQTYSMMEIIACDDGSRDGSVAILDAYALNYPQLKVIHKTNGGVSSARNAALSQASGDYIGFVDCDDYVDLTMYEKMVNKLESGNYDLVGVNTNALYPNKTLVIDSGLQENAGNKHLLIDAYAVLWNKLYKADLLKGLVMKEGYVYEDVLYLYQVYPRVNKVGRVEETLYYYPQNANSITYTYSDSLYNLVDNLDDIINYYQKHQLYQAYQEELEYTYVRYLYATFIKRMAKTGDYQKYQEAVKFVLNKVKTTFPDYKNNKYLKQKQPKALYLRTFNQLSAKLIYKKEHNKMN